MKTIMVKNIYLPLAQCLVVPDEEIFKPSDLIVFADSNGLHLATVEKVGGKYVPNIGIDYVRRATNEDATKMKTSQNKARRAKRYCQSLLLKHKLDIKIISVYVNLDSSKMIFFFTSANRVDFRDLVKDLASEYRMRIEMRQIGEREEVSMLGGVGPCGQLCCCKRFLGKCGQASIKMAKTQGLALNPTKINGYCGKLMCCLAFENETYVEALRVMPKVGSTIKLPDGERGVVHFNNLLEKIVTVECGEDNLCYRDYSLDELQQCNPKFEGSLGCCGSKCKGDEGENE